MTKRKNLLDSRDQFAKALGGKRICDWCAPHFRARLAGRSFDHTHCDDFDCGCYCRDGKSVN